MRSMTHIGYMITDHGLGHAARACAVMNALSELDSNIRFTLIAKTPAWFLSQSLEFEFVTLPLTCDLGLMQKNAFQEDPKATLDRLNQSDIYSQTHIDHLARVLSSHRFDALVSDISPIAAPIARTLSIPSVLIENFTWDWIYEAYQTKHEEFEQHISYLKELTQQFDRQYQTTPICHVDTGAIAVDPVYRGPRRQPNEVRRELGIAEDDFVVLMSWGGLGHELGWLQNYEHNEVKILVAAGMGASKRGRSVISLGQDMGYYHPDLMAACDGVIAKLGYSTVAEAWSQGRPIAYVGRETFREAPVLERFVCQQLPAVKIEQQSLDHEVLKQTIHKLRSFQPAQRTSVNGADRIAHDMREWLP